MALINTKQFRSHNYFPGTSIITTFLSLPLMAVYGCLLALLILPRSRVRCLYLANGLGLLSTALVTIPPQMVALGPAARARGHREAPAGPGLRALQLHRAHIPYSRSATPW